MIRDPSDGTVKPAPLVSAPHNSGERLPSSDAAGGGAGTFSGLPLESQKPEAQAKLEKSRAWLKEYHRKPERGHD